MEKEMQILLKQAVEVVNKVEDPELTDMIHRFDYSPTPELFKNLKIFEFGPDISKYQMCELMNKAMMCTGFIKNIVEGNI